MSGSNLYRGRSCNLAYRPTTSPSAWLQVATSSMLASCRGHSLGHSHSLPTEQLTHHFSNLKIDKGWVYRQKIAPPGNDQPSLDSNSVSRCMPVPGVLSTLECLCVLLYKARTLHSGSLLVNCLSRGYNFSYPLLECIELPWPLQETEDTCVADGIGLWPSLSGFLQES